MEYTITYANQTDTSVVDATSVDEALEKAAATLGFPGEPTLVTAADGKKYPVFVTDADGNKYPVIYSWPIAPATPPRR